MVAVETILDIAWTIEDRFLLSMTSSGVSIKTKAQTKLYHKMQKISQKHSCIKLRMLLWKRFQHIVTDLFVSNFQDYRLAGLGTRYFESIENFPKTLHFAQLCNQ